MHEWAEISDTIVAFDPATLERQPVLKASVVERFRRAGNARAMRVVQQIPDSQGILEPAAVDRLLVSVHCEMQRISEEFQHGQRVLELVRPLIGVARTSNPSRVVRIVDVGCGTGFVIRWLAAHGALGHDVELVGVDYNEALVAEARRLAEVENLRCTFHVANAFRLDPPGAIYLSTGVIHHFRNGDLSDFLAQHDRPDTAAFLHFDFQPSRMAPLGAWLFHAVRMRSALAKHDGVVSARRAYSGAMLLSTGSVATSNFALGMFSTRLWRLPIPRAFHTLIGIRRELRDAFVAALGRRASRLELQ